MEFARRPQRERLGDFVYGQLLEKIVSGAFVDGERLPSEKELSELFDVSRPVVREAILRLQSDEIVVARQGSGTYVRKKPSQRLVEFASGSAIAGILRCQEVRVILEGEAARLAALRRSATDLAHLEVARIDLQHEFESGAIRPAIDIQFHRTVVVCAHNEILSETFEFLVPKMEAGVVAALHVTRSGSADRAKLVYEEHQRIYEAIVDGDGEAAETAMRYHLIQARKRMMDARRD